MSSKEINKLENKIDIIQDKIDRLEMRIEQLNLSEIIIKGKEIEKIYTYMNKIGVIDTFNIYNEILQIKQILNSIIYHPWEWLERDPNARNSFFSVLNRRIAEEVSNAALFTLYEEQPNVVVKIVKDVVKEYLDIWEINDQIAIDITRKALKEKGVMNEIIKDVISISVNYVIKEIKNYYKDQLSDVKNLLNEYG